MKAKLPVKIVALCAILAVVLLAPALVQAKGEMEKHLKEFQGKTLKQMNLPPDKQKAFMAVNDKYAAERQKIIADLKTSQEDLKTAVAAAKPDEGKIKDLVSAITAGQEKLFASFKNQRDEELALLSPVDQGKYLVAITQWRHDLMDKCMKQESGKNQKGTEKKK